jgi:NTP pyrophosphatase (non-canonical NTP hydrolase)
MTFEEYQRAAQATDQVPLRPVDSEIERERALMVPLLGLAGEAGSLLTEYKKWLRERDAYVIFEDRIVEELGDVLWYVANLATKAGLDLGTIATRNLTKASDRWRMPDAGLPGGQRLLDEAFPETEQLPRQFRVELREIGEGGQIRVMAILNGEPYGDPLTDNAYEDDGYRFHDVFHLGYAALLGWSPITRRNLKRKRKSDPTTDEVEDGARAAVIEEAVSALTFNHAATHSFFDGVAHVEYDLLVTIKRLTAQLEVSRRSLHDWEHAILESYRVWRSVMAARGGVIIGDLSRRTLEFQRDVHVPSRFQ